MTTSYSLNIVVGWLIYHNVQYLLDLPFDTFSSHLDWEADDDEKEVCRGEARQEGVGRRLEGGLPHHCQDYQDVATHSEAERKAGNEKMFASNMCLMIK